MGRKLVFILFFLVLSSYMICLKSFVNVHVKATDGYLVHNPRTGLNYTTIQAAINANDTKNGDSIIVDAGHTYYEHVIVNKSISLFGQDEHTTIIDASGNGPAVTITKSNVNVTKFTIQNSTVYSFAGIHLKNASHCNITGNTLLNNYYGIYLNGSSNNIISENHFGGCGLHVSESYSNAVVNNSVNDKPLVYLEDASNLVVNDAGQVVLVSCNNISVENLNLSNTTIGVEMWNTNHTVLTQNRISNSKVGISLDGSSCNNAVLGNTVAANMLEGISLYGSSRNNTISGNNVTDNYFGINLYAAPYNNTVFGNSAAYNFNGIRLYACSNNTISENNATRNHQYGISLFASSNNTVFRNNATMNSWDGIRLFSSSYNSILKNTITSNCEFGIHSEWYSCNNTISQNDITNNWDGIDFNFCSNNTLSENNFEANIDDGIFLSDSYNNNITENDVTSNSIGINLNYSYGNLICRNNFVNNNHQAVSYNSVNSWNGSYPYGGNYWSDYKDVDEKNGPNQDHPGSDGIWDHPYIIDENNADHYPKVPEFSFPLILFPFMIVTLLIVAACKRKQTMRKRTVPG